MDEIVFGLRNSPFKELLDWLRNILPFLHEQVQEAVKQKSEVCTVHDIVLVLVVVGDEACNRTLHVIALL